MLTQVPSSNHAREDIHEQSDIDEAVLEADVGDIAYPDLITSTDLRGLQVIPPGLHTVSGAGRLTRTFDETERFAAFIKRATRFIAQRCVLRTPTPS